MKIDADKDELVFESTGRREYANNGIVGLCPEGFVWKGYDSPGPENLTSEERRELAIFMIEAWARFGLAP